MNLTNINLTLPKATENCFEVARQSYDSYFVQELLRTRIVVFVLIIIIAILYFRIRYLTDNR